MNGCQDNTTCNISQSSSSVNASPETGCPDVQANFQFVLFPVVYSIVFVLGLAGNLTALWHFIKTRSATQPSNVFLVNLCSIDLLLALTLPLKIVYHALGNNWIFGEALCKVDGSLFFGNVYGSSLFLMLISLDRYVAVVHPLFSLRIRKPKYRIILSCGCWGEEDQGHLECFREHSRHFRHTWEGRPKVIERHLRAYLGQHKRGRLPPFDGSEERRVVVAARKERHWRKRP
ncbi:GPR17 protein, partial [Polypterus senegalus]